MSLAINGDGSIGPLSSTEVGYLDGVTSAVQTQINTKSPIASPTFTGTVTTPINLGFGGFNLVANAIYTDSAVNTIYNVQNLSGILFITSTLHCTAIPFYSNGGAGVAFAWTILDPDTGWLVNTGGTFSFTQAGSGTHAFSVVFSTGNGSLTVQRTGGTGNYAVRLMIFGGNGMPS